VRQKYITYLTESPHRRKRAVSDMNCRAIDYVEMSPFAGNGTEILRQPHYPRTLKPG
jgi:hypothetical protein